LRLFKISPADPGLVPGWGTLSTPSYRGSDGWSVEPLPALPACGSTSAAPSLFVGGFIVPVELDEPGKSSDADEVYVRGMSSHVRPRARLPAMEIVSIRLAK
jgi:hypothetical protein